MRRSARPESWRSHLPGLLILACIIAASLAVFFMDTIRRSLLEGPRIVVLAAEARGLSPGADVWVAGSPSGRVTDVSFRDPEGPGEGRVVIHAILYHTAIPYLRADARASIASSSLLAPVVLKLDPGQASGDPFDAADTLYVPRNLTAETFLGLAAAGKQAMDSLQRDLRSLAQRLDRGPGTLAALRNDSALVSRLPAAAARLRDLGRAARSADALPALVARDSVRAVFRNAASSLGALSTDDRAARVADSVAALAASLERISARLSRMDAFLREGSGTAGRALYDDEIHRQREALRAGVDSVLSELREAPMRWLRFKLF
jgi:phospholipid/cholesterol/gamma-HCH transport system substrate-binding protein